MFLFSKKCAAKITVSWRTCGTTKVAPSKVAQFFYKSLYARCLLVLYQALNIIVHSTNVLHSTDQIWTVLHTTVGLNNLIWISIQVSRVKECIIVLVVYYRTYGGSMCVYLPHSQIGKRCLLQRLLPFWQTASRVCWRKPVISNKSSS